MLNAELKILAGKYQGKAIPLSTKRFLVGREQDCQLRPNSELVSRHHCVFVIDDFAVRLRDLGSTNGTRVNGDLVKGEIVLKPGDRITIGRLDVELVVRTAAAVAAKSPVPAAVVAAATSAAPLGGTQTIEMPVMEAPTAVPQGAETSFEISATAPAPVVPAETNSTVANFGGDTAILPGATGAPMVPLAANPQMMPMGFPMGYGYGMPGYGAPMPGYGYGMPQGYPMAMPGMPMMPQYPQMPQQMMPQQQMPQQQMPQQGLPAGGGAAAAASTEQPVKLPDPTTTGVKAPAPAAPAAAGQPAAAAQSLNPSQSAADIIKQFMQKRSTTE